MTDVTPPPAPPTTPIWEDFVDIFTSPTAVFERRKDDPQFFAAMMMLTAAIAVITIASWDLLQPVRQMDQARGLDAYIRLHPALTADQIETIRGRASGGGSLGRWLGWLLAPVTMLCGGLVLWLNATVVRASTNVGQAFLIATYAFPAKILAMIASIVLAVALPDAMLNTAFHLTLSPALFLSPDAMRASTLVLFSRLDLTAAWGVALTAIGIRVTGGITMGRAIMAAVLAWGIATILVYVFVYGAEALQGLH